jgi:NADH-quinone oxidoreductase subunit M
LERNEGLREKKRRLWRLIFFQLNSYLFFFFAFFSLKTFFCIVIMLFCQVLNFVVLTPFIGCFVLSFLSNFEKKKLWFLSLFFSLVSLFFSLFLWLFFNYSSSKFQFVCDFLWIPETNLNFSLGIDGISVFFVVLTTFLFSLCLLASWFSIFVELKLFLICFLFMEGCLLLVFTILDLLLFYIFFESILIPMFLIIGVWGSRERKIRAAYFFFLYTLFGSILMLIAVVFMAFYFGTTDYETLLLYEIDFNFQKYLWFAFFASFGTKVPMLPVHIWLPEAHVEAPTSGSVILAGILLKLGVYGFLRFSLPFFPLASYFFAPLIYTLCVIAIVYTSLTAIRQTDLKRVIAYTSVAHMNLVVLGLFSFNSVGILGAVLQSLSHGFVASALFLVIGVLYDRHHTRMIKYFSGLVYVMPLFSVVFLIFTMANLGLPGSSSFVGEFLLFAGIFKANTLVAFFSVTGVIFSGAYSLFLFNRIVYGNLKTQYLSNFRDLDQKEGFVFIPLVFFTLFFGIFPEALFNVLSFGILDLTLFISDTFYFTP